jgi:hypothetical protein
MKAHVLNEYGDIINTILIDELGENHIDADLYGGTIGDRFDGNAVFAPVLSTEQLQAEVRAKRNQLLSASDWTQVADAPVDKAAWATYRQALREIPQQEGFPATVVWPTQPE